MLTLNCFPASLWPIGGCDALLRSLIANNVLRLILETRLVHDRLKVNTTATVTNPIGKWVAWQLEVETREGKLNDVLIKILGTHVLANFIHDDLGKG